MTNFQQIFIDILLHCHSSHALQNLIYLFFTVCGLADLTCANVRCAENRECVECEPNECNTYTCDNPDGNGAIACSDVCLDPGPRCICRPNFEEIDGECVPLICDYPPPCSHELDWF